MLRWTNASSRSGCERIAEPGAGPNDEERRQAPVPVRGSLSRSSSSVSFALAEMNKWQIICPVTVFLLLLGLFSPFSTVLWKPYDVARLAVFARKIADADRVVGTHIGKSVTAEIRGDDLLRVIREVSSAHPARPPLGTGYACVFAL